MKIIFLDIDGVLNHTDYYERGRLHEGQEFCPFATRHLREIIKLTGAKIVVSSTWRKRGLRRMKEVLKCYDLSRYCIDITPIIDGAERGEEIQQWITEYEESHEPLESFVILDDDDDMAHLLPHLVQTNPYQKGLTDEKRNEAIEKLTKRVVSGL